MTHASLFSGIGGFDLAAEQVGWTNLFNCEFNPICRRVLDYHFPESIGYGDITKTDFKAWQGQVDVLSGGFPCQPFSLAGQRKGEEDHRYLWPEMLRAIEECQPTWVVGENVAGLLSMVQSCETIEVESQTNLFGEVYTLQEQREKYTLAKIIEDLEGREYSVQTFVVPACAVGAPHRRDRVWIIAHSDNARAQSGERARADVPNCVRPPAYSNNARDRERLRGERAGAEDHQEQPQDLPFNELRSLSEEEPTAHPYCDVRQGERDQGQREGQPNGRDSEAVSARRAPRGWCHFPSQPPVCGRDDGLPRGLDSITFSRWRAEAIKAYGNAIVPEVARRLFLAIDAIEKGGA